MIIEFKINMLLGKTRTSIIYPLSKEESYLLLDAFDIDFLRIPKKSEVVTLSIDVLFEDKGTIENIITILTDVFPHNLSIFKESLKSKKNPVEQYVDNSQIPYILNPKDIVIELDKVFMIHYVFAYNKDRSNVDRNILRKMKKVNIVTVNRVPLVKKISLSITQYFDLQKIASRKGRIKGNFYVIDTQNIPKEKWTKKSTDYYIYLYRKGTNFVQNEKDVYYVILRSKYKGISENIEVKDTEITVNNQNILERCKLFTDIQTRPLHWQEILGLLSNLKNVKMKLQDTRILATSYIEKYIGAINQKIIKPIVKFIKSNNSYELECNKYCPYKEECHHSQNMLSTVHIKKNQIVKLDKEENYITVEQAREQLCQKEELLYNNLLSGKTNMGLLIAQTGIGKTEKAIELIIRTINNGMGCIYAIPNRKTIDNFVKRLEKRGFNDYIITPVIEKLVDEKIQKEINYLQDIGAYNKLKRYLYKLLKKDNLFKEDREKIEKYIQLNEIIKQYNGLIITTHNRFPYFAPAVYENKIAFVDEDIFDTDFVRAKTMSMLQIENIIKGSSILSMDKLNEIKKMKDNIVTPIFAETFNPEGKKMIEKELRDMRKNPVNIFDFFSCTAVKKYWDGHKHKVKCFNFSNMPPIPVMIMSATAEKEFYQLVFGDNRTLQIEEVQKARYEGRIILWDSHTYSQEFLSNQENLKYIEDLIMQCRYYKMNLVTFKDFIEKNKSKLIDDETEINPKLLDGINCYNFFSILGYDDLKDNDLAVIGKPLKDDDIFYFLALLVYNKKYEEKQRCEMQIVEDKGFLFQLYTYNDETLRKIQMWSISSNEEQYVGRARVIGNSNRTVYLASGYPVEQMEIEDEEE